MEKPQVRVERSREEVEEERARAREEAERREEREWESRGGRDRARGGKRGFGRAGRGRY